MSTKIFSSHIERLLWVMSKLRDPADGCPWDLKQNFSTIVPYTIEEAYELADAIEKGNMDDIKDELGDLLFQVVFYAQLGKEQTSFDFEAIAEHLSEKMIKRHPHVFANEHIEDDNALKARWDEIKAAEKGHSTDDESILANIPDGLAPILKAEKIQKRCAKVGFDWPNASPVFDKVREEIIEIEEELLEKENINQQAVEEEVGDLLFAVVNLARHLNVNAETALIKANNKFESRFRQVEGLIQKDKADIKKLTLEDLEQYWITAKTYKAANKPL